MLLQKAIADYCEYILQRTIMNANLSMSPRNDVNGSLEINQTASSGRTRHGQQVTPGRHPATGRIQLHDSLIIGT